MKPGPFEHPPMWADLLVGEAVYAAVSPILNRITGISVEKNAYLEPDCIVGLTDIGKQIVRDCSKAAEAEGKRWT